jgi:hypothetical protein
MLLQTVSLALAAGAVLGFLGATLSRVAMRILALTSPARLKGSFTDDKEIVGQFHPGRHGDVGSIPDRRVRTC